jgi:hypothetical protein
MTDGLHGATSASLMEVTMKKFLTTAVALAALTIPFAAQAAPHGGGGHGGGGFRGGGGFHGSAFHGGGFRGYRVGYGGRYYGGGWGYGAAAFGLGLGLGALAYDDYYAYPGYGAPVIYGDPGYSYAPPPVMAAPQAACGQWLWDQGQGKYAWAPGPCPAG